jgi:hypothetical protein
MRAIVVIATLTACHSASEPTQTPDAVIAPPGGVIANKSGSRLVVDGSTLFFWSTDGLWRVELDGSGLRRLVDSAATTDAPFTVGDGLADLDIAGDKVVLLDAGHHARDFLDGALRTVPRDGGVLTSLREGLYFPAAATVHDGRIYWGEIDGGGVRSVRADGSDYQTHVWCADCYHESIAASTAGLWYTLSGNTTGRVLLVGGDGAETEVAGAQRNPRSLVVDGRDVFWISQFTLSGEPGAVMHARPGQPAAVIAGGIALPGSLSVDASDVYFVDQSVGSLHRVARGGGAPEIVLASGVVAAAPCDAGLVVSTQAEIRLVPRP